MQASGVLTGKYSGGRVPEGSRLALPSYEWLRNIVMAKDRAPRLECADKLKVLAETVVGCTAAQARARQRGVESRPPPIPHPHTCSSP